MLSDQIDRAKLRTTLQYRINSRIQVGVEWNPLADEVAPLANIHILTETNSRPAVLASTSTDRIGTPEGQSYTLTVSKDLTQWTHLPIAPYAGVAYGTYEDKARAIGGLYIRFPQNFSSTIIFDGVHVHPTFGYEYGPHVVSLVLVRGRDPGFSYSISF